MLKLLIAINVGDKAMKYLSEVLKVNSTLIQLTLIGKPETNSIVMTFY